MNALTQFPCTLNFVNSEITYISGGSHRGRPYALILLITFGVALLGVMVLHKLRERRIYTLIVKEKDHQILALQLLLQKERDRSKELRGKNEEMNGKIYALRSKKMELSRTVVEMQSTLDSLKDEQKLMESAFEEQQNELRLMQEKRSNEGQGGSEIEALRENLKHKEANIEDLKHRLDITVNDNPTVFTESVTANETMAAEYESEKNKSSKYDNEDASKSELTEVKSRDVATEIKDEDGTDGKVGKTNEDPRDDGGVRAKDNDDAEVEHGRENKAIREEQASQVENSTDGAGQDIKEKQLTVMKRKHGRASRTKGKHWSRGSIVKNSLIENNGVFDNHMRNRKVNKDELKNGRDGKVSDEESFARDDEGMENDNRRKGKPQAKLVKPENKDDNGMKVNDTNHQVTNTGAIIYPEKQRRDEMRQSKENKQSLVQQNWSKKHINKAIKNAGLAKPKVLIEGLEQLDDALDVQMQEKDAIENGHDDVDNNDDDFFK
ncbi:hypothetical protein Fmac_021693 [Flemingia macrophylla]|uniref:Micronuclear linker histone polyprotein-like protein n=1 Tax=Flemingia macrophylla TaxID=520843 RepID=A0ABD1LXQ1_9FABA